MCRCESGWSPQFRWAEDDRLSSTIRRAYRPWQKPWRSGFDSRHGVPPFDHATCPSDFAQNGNKAASAICVRSQFARTRGQSRSSTAIEHPKKFGRRGFDSHRARQFRRAADFGFSVKRETASAFKPRTIGQPMDSHLAFCPSFSFFGWAAVLRLSNWVAQLR